MKMLPGCFRLMGGNLGIHSGKLPTWRIYIHVLVCSRFPPYINAGREGEGSLSSTSLANGETSGGDTLPAAPEPSALHQQIHPPVHVRTSAHR